MNVWEFVGNYWWLVFPIGAGLAGVGGSVAKGVRSWDERRRAHKLELARIKYGAKQARAQRGGRSVRRSEPDAARDSSSYALEAKRLIGEHEAVDARWLAYELDLGKLIDFPVMSDMREQVTIDFHRAKRAADGLRPQSTERIGPDELARYREAVREYEVTFEIAEREARRRRAADFSADERKALDRAKKFLALAEDSSATQAERQQAYRRTQRELTGLIAVPDAADEALRQRIAGVLEPRAPSSERETYGA